MPVVGLLSAVHGVERPGGAAVPGIELRLAYRPPLAFEPLLSFLAARAVPGIEHVAGRTYRRSVRTDGGGGVLVELTPDPDRGTVRLRIRGHGDDASTPAALARTARQLMDLDADPRTIDGVLAADPAMSPLVSSAPGTRVPGAAEGFELAVRAIVGQQVSVAGARTTLGRIVARLGTAIPGVAGPVTSLFPTPAAVAAASREDLGVPGARAGAIRELARRVDRGELDLSGRADLGETRDALGSIPGVGPWTVAYVAMRALRDPDAFPTGDLGLRNAFAALGLPADPRSMESRAEWWRPWRAYAAMHLWRMDTGSVAAQLSGGRLPAARPAPGRGAPGRGRR